MATPVILNEQKVISLLRQFFKDTELEPSTAVASAEQQDLPLLPKVITSLRNEIVAGNWTTAIQLLNSLSVSSSDLSSMKYSVYKQRYLESLNTLFSSKVQLKEEGLQTLGKDEVVKYVNPEHLKLVATHLKGLEGMCSQEDYFKLSFLISCPDLRTHPNFSDWSVESGRLQVASEVCQRAMKLKHPSLFDRHCVPTSKPKRCNRLMQLVAKGILYEKCQNFLLQHHTGSNKEICSEHGEMLDVCSWLESLPTDTLQLPVHKLSLYIEEQCSVKSSPSCDSLPSSLQQYTSSNGHDHVPTVASNATGPPEIGETEKMTIDNKHSSVPLSVHCSQVAKDVTREKVSVADGDNNVAVDERQYHNIEQAEDDAAKYHLAQEIKTEVNGYDNDLQQPQKKDTLRNLQPRDVYTPENCPIEVQPVVNSSTPKPSHGKHMVELPVTSPIGYDKEAPDYGPYHTPTSLRRQVMTKNRPEFPRYRLVGNVTESQAVRAVAFEPAGQFVAIGANSKSLRVCSLQPILQHDDTDESCDLPVLYHHPKYHKGSVYCLAWSADGMIASGSNDQTIRFLRFDRDTSTVTGPPEDIHIHKGTIRDVLFLSDGYLSSAGAGDCTVKVYDYVAQRCVRSFTGHSSQVLALSSVMDSNSLILSAGHDHNLILWDLRQPVAVLTSKLPSPVTSVTNHGKDICVALQDGSLSFLDLRQLSVTHQLQYLHRDECRSVCYSPNGDYVLSGSYERTVQLTDVYSKLSKVVVEHEDKIVQCRWHCSGKMFASTSVDKHVCFWQE